MQARIPNPISRLRTTAPRRGYRQTERTDVPVAESSTPVETRVREAGGPEDSAHYTCSCGMVFQASVSASVACPHCGLHQDW
jgi:hypothetical protein